jgi:KipI family sensor histidine kinase inhibitor
VPTRYDGPDLAEVAEHWQMTPREVVDLHTSTEMVVAFCGFSPGFAYCTGLERTVPRRPNPRTRVPPGSVALADAFTGVYPTASPGGWQLIGRTELVLWDDSRESPATLVPGTRLRFVEVRA